MALFFIILGVSIWLACMVLVVVLLVKPDLVKITQKIVCPPGTTMEVTFEVYSYHRPGQRAINIFYTDESGCDHNINGRAILALLGIFFILSLPFVTVVVFWIRHLIQSA